MGAMNGLYTEDTCNAVLIMLTIIEVPWVESFIKAPICGSEHH